MFFTIDASNNLIDSYRLKRNEKWKKLDVNNQRYDDDMIFKTFSDADLWLSQNSIVEINGVQIETNPRSVELFSDSNYDFSIITHRITAPKHLFTKEELRKIILTGDNTKTNCLVVTLDGYLELTRPAENKTPLTLKGYAVRFETFGAYNNYVGPDTDLSDLDDLYITLLDEWLTHLITGKMCYTDIFGSQYPEKELMVLIDTEIQKIVG